MRDRREVPSIVALTASIALLGACPSRSPDRINPDGGTVNGPPAVIIMIGDGMGKGQLDSASYYLAGQREQLFMYSLPHRGELVTGSPTGITDSAAAATALGCGDFTYNKRLCIDRDGERLTSLLEIAHAHDWATGLVTTTSVTHATPAAFGAHNLSRGNEMAIADEMATETRPHVLLGGGRQYFAPAGEGSLRDDDGLIDPMTASGYTYVSNSTGLDVAVSAKAERMLGLFAAYHMPYVRELPEGHDVPSLAQMSMAAIETLGRDPDGFVLMIEGGRIDHAGHGNNIDNTIGETLAFDEAIRSVTEWASGRDNVTVIVTADHETGGLSVSSGDAGEVPSYSWRWGGHTNARVDVFALGPETELFDGRVRDQRWVYAAARARIEGAPLLAPPHVPLANGYMDDLRHTAAVQTVATGLGEGVSQLDSLRLDADEYGLVIGLEGLFSWDRHAVVILLDADYPMDTGVSLFAGAINDRAGAADRVVSNLKVDARRFVGFGAELVVVAQRGLTPSLTQLHDVAGVRGLYPPYGFADDLGWYGASQIYGDQVRTVDAAPRQPLSGLEVAIPWDRLYPDLDGAVPPGATIGLAAFFVANDGAFFSNQALPPFAAGTPNPGAGLTQLPGIVSFTVDGNGDWIADGDPEPVVVR